MDLIGRWYWHHFLKGVCFHLPLVALLTVLIALPFNVFGEEVGVVQLVWYENLLQRPLVGAALAVVALQALYVSYLLWDRARAEGRLDSDPGPLSFGRFALYTVGCLVATLVALGALWWLVGWLAGADADPSPDPVTTEDPRPGWLRAAVPDRHLGLGPTVWRVGLLFLGAAAAFAVVGGASWAGFGRWVAARKLVEHGRKRLLHIDRRLRGPDTNGRTRLRAAGIGVVLATWVVCPAAGATRDERTLVVLTVYTMLGVLMFLGCVFCDLWCRWSSNRAAALAFVANLLAYLVPVFLGVSYVLSAYGFWPGVVAAAAGAVALLGLAAALPGPAGEWVGGILMVRARRARAAARAAHHARAGTAAPRPADPLQVWPFVVLGGALFFLPFNLFDRLASPAPIVCCFLCVVVVVYGVATVVVRRAIPVALTVLLFLAVLAGVERYKFRYDPGIAGMDYAAPLDLRAAADRDSRLQQAFDAALPDYKAARDRLARATNDYYVNEARRADDLFDLLALGAVVRAHAEADAPRLERARDAAEAQLAAERERLAALWRAMEEHNRVLPPRNVRHDLELGFLQDAVGPDRYLLNPRDWPSVPDPKDRQPMVVIAVSGGGLRSAAWTFTVLRTLEERFAERGIDFPSHVRIITGASGGMFGAAYYVTTLRQKRAAVLARAVADRKTAALAAYNTALYEKLTADHLTPLVQQHVFEDVPNLFSPWPARNDRGKELERSWSRYLDGALDVPFAALHADERAGRIPSLVFTPMMVEDGRRLIVSNLDMRNALTNDGNMLLEGPNADPYGSECHSRDALELFRMFPDAPARFRVSTAVRMSASFPFFSPAVSLPVVPRRRIVDAGYYDNYGVSLGAAWLISRSNRNWLTSHTSKVLLIQVRDGVDQPQRKLNRIDRDGSSRMTRAVEELSSPFEGLYNARVGSSSFRNDGQLEILTQYFSDMIGEPNQNRDVTDRLFQVVNFEFQERAALSWYLSKAERDRVAEAMSKAVPEFDIDYNARVGLIHRWWASESVFDAQLSAP